MESERAWEIIGANLEELVGAMLTLQKGARMDAFCDPEGSNLSFSKPSGASNVKFCTVTPPDLGGSYGVYPHGAGYVNSDGEEITKERLPAYLVQYIIGERDGGAEWGWEFKIDEDN
jgi:hypothetical protein